MNSHLIDPIISTWATKHRLTLYTRHKDEEVRSVDIVSPQGQKYQIWIDQPEAGSVTIHAWDYKKRRIQWNVPTENLDQKLDEASLWSKRGWLKFVLLCPSAVVTLLSKHRASWGSGELL